MRVWGPPNKKITPATENQMENRMNMEWKLRFCRTSSIWGLPKIRGLVMGVPRIRAKVHIC